MKIINRKLWAAILAGACLSAPAHAGDLYVFGDALSDDGNIPKLTGIDYPPPPNYENRFSNGPVWPEYFPGLTGLGFTASNDYAVGGAFAGPLTIDGTTYDNLGNVPLILGGVAAVANAPLPGFLEEVQNFAATGTHLSNSDVVGVWVGGDDYYALLKGVAAGLVNPVTAFPTAIQTVAQQTTAGIDALTALGGRRFIVFNLPDLGDLPALNSDGAATVTLANEITAAHNATLTQYMAGAHASTGANIIVMNIATIFNEILADPAAYGKTNTTTGCLETPSCANASTAVQNQYVFWDDISHLTTGTQLLVAEYAASALNGLAGLAAPAQIAAFGADAFADQLDQRTEALRAGASGFSVDLPEQNMSGQIGGGGKLSGFVSGSYDYGNRNTIGADNGFTYNIGTVAAGLDYQPLPGIAIGAALGYGTDHGSVVQDGTVSADAYQFGAYAAFFQPNFYLTLGFTYGFDNYNNARPGVLSDITAKPSGNTVTVGGEMGYVLNAGAFTYGPIAGLNVTNASLGSYTESGDPGLTQSVDAQTFSQVIGDVGVTASAAWPVGTALLHPYVTLTADQLFSGNGGSFDSIFTDEPEVPLTTTYPSTAHSWGEVSGGLSGALTSRIALAVNFASTFAKSDGADHEVSGALRMSF